MDFANRGNRPSQAPQQQQQQPAGDKQPSPPQASFQPMKSSKNKSKFNFSKIMAGTLLIGTTFLVLALIFGIVFGVNGGKNEVNAIQTNKYQAVFLDSQDGQVYFGKLEVYNKNQYKLTDIYYVRVENPIQPEGADQVQQPNISLAKLGNELHGPQDTMYINRDKVLYWENLKDDGQVVTAIIEFKANGEPAPAQQQTTAPPAETVPTEIAPVPAETTPEETTPPATEPETDPTP